MSETPAIEADGLVKHYGKTKALDGLDLTVRRAPSTGCSARTARARPPPSGCSPRCCAPDGGRARVLGRDVTAEAATVRRTIGLTGQYAALDEYLTGRSNLIMIGQLSRLTAKAARRRADELLEQFDLTAAAEPGGQDLLRRHAPPPRPGGLPDRPPVGAVPRRADHRPRPERPRADVGHRAPAGRRRHHAAAHHPVPGRGRPAGRAGSPSSTAARSSPRARPPNSRRRSAGSGC